VAAPGTCRTAALACRIAALAGLLALGGCAGAGGEAFQPTTTRALPLTAEQSVGQTFRPATDAVAGIDLLVATFDAPADAGGVLTVDLVGGAGGRVLASAEVPGDALGDNEWVAVRFPRPAPAPAAAAIDVRWRGATPVGLWANVPPPGYPAAQDSNDPYPGGELLVDGAPAQGDLAFRVVGAGGPAAAAGKLARTLGGAGGRLLGGQPIFAAAWLLGLAGACALAVSGLRRGGPRPAHQLRDGRRGEEHHQRDEAGP